MRLSKGYGSYGATSTSVDGGEETEEAWKSGSYFLKQETRRRRWIRGLKKSGGLIVTMACLASLVFLAIVFMRSDRWSGFSGIENLSVDPQREELSRRELGFEVGNKYIERDGRLGMDYPQFQGDYIRVVEPYRKTILRAMVVDENGHAHEAPDDCVYEWDFGNVRKQGKTVEMYFTQVGNIPFTLIQTPLRTSQSVRTDVNVLNQGRTKVEKSSPPQRHRVYRTTESRTSQQLVDELKDAVEHDRKVSSMKEGEHKLGTISPGKGAGRWLKETTDSIKESARVMEGVIAVRYVRREIRSLFKEDREAYFDALETMYRHETQEGRVKFGTSFVSMQDLCRQHLLLAAAQDCDHLHDGPGFLGNHLALTFTMDKSLQTIDPSVITPYWDYLIEGHAVTKTGDPSAWYETEVWNDDWFGNGQPEGFVLTKGRWAYTPIQKGSGYVKNAYGLLRAPWNQNKNAYLTRHNMTGPIFFGAVPKCDAFDDLLKYTSRIEFTHEISYSPHGGAHIQLGGFWGAEGLVRVKEAGYDPDLWQEFVHFFYAYQRLLFKDGFMTCPSQCDESTPQNECKCTCPDLGKIIAEDKVQEFLERIYSSSLLGGFDTMTSEVRVTMLRVLCNDYDDVYVVFGDSASAESAIDPQFWPIHPTIDRLYQWKLLNDDFDDNSWEAAEDACYGHNPDDMILFKMDLPSCEDCRISNKEFLEFLDPRNDELHYIYDNFRWKECEDEGYSVGFY